LIDELETTRQLHAKDSERRIMKARDNSFLADCLFDGIEQQFCRKWFTQERDAACGSGLPSNHVVVEARHEYDRVGVSIRRQLMCKFDA
jgi:hypothetical protein